MGFPEGLSFSNHRHFEMDSANYKFCDGKIRNFIKIELL